jgi:uncharacterized repeat protein (TIGR01451 family)
MAINRKFIKRASTATLVLWLCVNLMTPVIYADEETIPTDTPAQSPATTDPQPTITETVPTSVPNPDPTPEIITQTGDAEAASQTQTEVNNNINNDSNNQNAATVAADLNSQAVSGDNTATGSGNTVIETGDATASGQMSTDANTNSDILQTPAPTEAPAISPPAVFDDNATPSAKPDPEVQEITVNNSNITDVANNADVSSLTGNNSGSANTGTVNINTGNADSLANVINVINTNIVGSDIEMVNMDLTCSENEDVDLNSIWKKLLTVDENGNVILNTGLPQTPNIKIYISDENQAAVVNNVNVSADTGNNSASGSGDTNISTGNATALANVTNIVNTNILGSKILMANINILTAQNINLILPRPEFFDPLSSAYVFRIPVTRNIQNEAAINNNVNAAADSGDNSTAGNSNSVTETGEAGAAVNSTTIANSNITGNSWFFMILNNTGSWTGNIVNWSAPGAVDKPVLGANILEAGSDPANTASVQTINNISNSAEVINNINVSANTGNNADISENGGANVSTGNARAVANLFNLINTNVYGSNWFMNNVNILGDWSGNAIFAYPDVGVSLATDRTEVQPGDIVNYDLHYDNSGYDTAKGVRLTLDLPDGMSFVSDNGKLTGGCGQTFCSWEVGTLNPKQSGDLGIQVKINDDFNFDQGLSREIPVKAGIEMADPDPDTNNNSYLLQEVVNEKSDPASSDQRQPEISITAANNVHEFVYPGDTVTFEIKVNNNADVPLGSGQLVQKIYGANGQYLGSMLLDLGTVEAHKSGRLTFGLTVPIGAGGGNYTTQAYVTGAAPNGNQITSGNASTRFLVKTKPAAMVLPLTALPTITGKPGGEVLGASTTYRGPWCTDRKQDIWIFVMLLLTSTVLFANRIEDKLENNYVKKTG